MWLHLKVPFTKDQKVNFIGYCYHSANIITFSLTQSDDIKRLDCTYIMILFSFHFHQKQLLAIAIFKKNNHKQ